MLMDLCLPAMAAELLLLANPSFCGELPLALPALPALK